MPKIKHKSDIPTHDVVIIGGGIIGSTISEYFRHQGIETLLLDSNEPLSGTAPSGGHLRPSWFKGMEKEDYIPAMDVLDQCWELIEEEFRITAGESFKLETFKRVNVDHVFKTPRTHAKAFRIEDKESMPLVRLRPLDAEPGALKGTALRGGIGKAVRAKLLIVAAGYWTRGLLPEVFPHDSDRYLLQGKTGISFRYSGQLKTPFVEQWAPYKQIVAHNQNTEEIWIGDGTAILDKNWTASKSAQCLKRCEKFLTNHKKRKHKLLKQLTGIRPFIKSGPVPCFCQRVYPNVWAVTGASKLGTIAAGWAALKIYNEHRHKD